MQISRLALGFVAVPCAVLVAWSAGCGSSSGNLFTSSGAGASGTGSASGAGAGSGNGNGAGAGLTSTGAMGGVDLSGANSSGSGTPCTGIACDVHACSGGGSTTITGKIYDPAGKNPLYGIVAYVPNSKPAAILSGASCYSCDQLYTGDPIATAITDATGTFTIDKAPDGPNIPLVIQVGKWRRQFTIPSVAMCGSTALPDGMLTLPKNASEGDMPNVAISTGSADTLECLLIRVGVDPAEYVPGGSGSGHIHIFGPGPGDNGAPNTSPPGPDAPTSLWDSKADLMKFDIVMFSCEGEETVDEQGNPISTQAQQNLFDYAAAGGRVFASHYHYAWFNTGPFGSANLANWSPGSNNINNINATVVTTTWANKPFQRGQDMHDWLQNVGALTNNELAIQAARHNADVTAANTPSQPWILADNQAQAPGSAQDFTFDTPIGAPAANQCGRIAFSDMHVGAASNDYGGFGNNQTTPGGCSTGDLSPQEKALEFIFFDLSSCVTPNNTVQMPPPPGMTQ